jgi:hypothetical protein
MDQNKPIRVGIFSTMAQADHAVRDLLAAGFTKDNITVICSDKFTEQHFHQFDHQQPAGSHTASAATAGGAIGALLGGLTAVAGFVATGGVGLLVGGALFAWSGAVAGGLIGAMMTRGVEKELANYYDQEVTRGKILVAAENTAPAGVSMLTKAEEIFARTGAEPVSLPEG